MVRMFPPEGMRRTFRTLSADTRLLWSQCESEEVRDDVKQSERAHRRSAKGHIVRKEHDPNTHVKAPSGAVTIHSRAGPDGVL